MKKIAKENTYILGSNCNTEDEETIWTSVTELCLLSIVDQMRTDKLFGSMGYVVQISEKFQEVLLHTLKGKEGKDSKMNEKGNNEEKRLDVETMENRNVWLIVKWSSIFLYSISLSSSLYEIKYSEIENVICYPSSIYIRFKDKLESKIYPSTLRPPETLESRSELYDKEAAEELAEEPSVQMSQGRPLNSLGLPSSIKFKTTSSYVIRELIVYYKNYNALAKKIEEDEDYTNSLIEMIQENSKVLNEGADSVKYSDSFKQLEGSFVGIGTKIYNKSVVASSREKVESLFRGSNLDKIQSVD